MKKIFVIVLAFALVLSLAAAAFAAGSPVTPPVVTGGGAGKGTGDNVTQRAPIVKFITGETQKGTPINAPYDEVGKAAVELADKVVKAIVNDEIEDEELKAAIEKFLEENEGSLASGIITMGENAAEDDVKLAVDAKGFDKVMFNAPGDAENLAFVVLEG